MQIKGQSIKLPTVVILLGLAAAIGIMHNATRSTSGNCAIDSNSNMKGRIQNMSHAAAVTKSDFSEKVIKSTRPVLVDFWAPWCGPCKMMAPTLDEIAAEYSGKVDVVKINTDENPDLAASYSISGIPTLILFKDGEPVDRVSGVQSKAALVDRINKALGH